jgi:hypothetical protein
MGAIITHNEVAQLTFDLLAEWIDWWFLEERGWWAYSKSVPENLPRKGRFRNQFHHERSRNLSHLESQLGSSRKCGGSVVNKGKEIENLRSGAWDPETQRFNQHSTHLASTFVVPGHPSHSCWIDLLYSRVLIGKIEMINFYSSRIDQMRISCSSSFLLFHSFMGLFYRRFITRIKYFEESN